jgi:NitT/TauT family transport system ATP-binding protein
MSLKLEHISKHFGSLEVFSDFSLELPEGRITCILGPSGCGKTTLLHLLSGQLQPDTGNISGVDSKHIAYVFQEPRLLPWKTVRGNLEFILSAQKDAGRMNEIVDHTLDVVGLRDFQFHYPAELSGGMKQRVALARAFAYPAELVLMDEPFRGLDIRMKQTLVETFRILWQEKKRTVLFVTHDLDEAIDLGEELILFSQAPVKIIKSFVIDKSGKNLDTVKKEIAGLMGMQMETSGPESGKD